MRRSRRRGEVIASLPSLSLLTLAGMTPECFDVEYHQVPDIRKLDRLPDCDLAAITTLTSQVKDAYALAGRYREAGVKAVIGGHHATALPGEALRHCDAVVVGEAELTWPRALEDSAMAGRLCCQRARCLTVMPLGRPVKVRETPSNKQVCPSP